MKNRIPLFALFFLLWSGLAATAHSTFFEFSGTLSDGGFPANGNYDMSFQLFPQAVGGTASSALLTGNAINVTNGHFTVSLDMGNVFDGSSDFWMELGAKPAGSVGSLVIVAPRLPIVASALALFANKAGSIVSGSIINPNFLGTKTAMPLDLVANNQRAFRLDGSGQDPNIIGGNSGNFIGGGAIGATISGGGTVGFTNRILGSYGTIGGGLNNRADGFGSTVSGGQQNTASGQGSAALGGYGNVASGDYSVAAGTLNRALAPTAAALGGSANTASGINTFVTGGTNSVSGSSSSIAGGSLNVASGNFSFISGGQANTASGNYSFVAGGLSNAATRDFAFASGRRAKANHQGAYVLADFQDLDFASTANNQMIVRAAGGVGINTNRPATALHVVGTVTATSFVGSGIGITNIGALGLASNSVANGAITNGAITASKIATNQVVKTINVVRLPLPPITMREDVSFAPGANIFLSANTNSNTIQISADISNAVPAWSTIGNWGLGSSNYIGTGDTVPFQLRVNGVHAMRYESSTNTPNIIGGASGNTVRAGISGATIAGGGNTNGAFNSVLDNFGTVSGGVGNVAGNSTTNIYATVGGGANNNASGFASTVPGGLLNSATTFGFAAGRRAKDVHPGTFVWADGTDSDFSSTGNNQFLIRAGGGVGINTATPGAGIALNVNGVFKAASYASNQLVKSITASGSTLRDDIVIQAGANISLLTSGNSIQISANSPGNIGWSTDGNIATSTNSFIGTGDNKPLEIRVNSSRAMRFEPTTNSPNIIGGYVSNMIGTNLVGVTISGGGAPNLVNAVTASFGTVAGGAGNTAGGLYSMAAGYRAQALHPGTFVWSDSINTNMVSTASNQFLIRASGGVGIGTNHPASALHVVGTITADAFNGALTGPVNATGTVTASSFAGSGAGLTSLNANALTTGTVPDARLNANVSRLDANQSFTGAVTFAPLNGAPFSVGNNSNVVLNLNANLLNGTRGEAFLRMGGQPGIGLDTWIGTSDATPFEVRVQNTRAFRAEPTGAGSPPNIIGGAVDNTVTGAVGATIGGGQGNNVSANFATVPGGSQARAGNYGQMAYASGDFANPGDAQTGTYVLRAETTNAVATEMFLDGISQRMVVPINTTWAFDAVVVARSTKNTSAGFQVKGVIANNNGTNVIVGVPLVTTLTSPGWRVLTSADKINHSLSIKVTGALSTRIRWTATVRTSEVGF
ncbi:MAG: hypothetical protein JWO95_1284 [Verrucomicrobiales bacterium]|nr:hypothetical protein [Verrucomicrobiales bacterium]